MEVAIRIHGLRPNPLCCQMVICKKIELKTDATLHDDLKSALSPIHLPSFINRYLVRQLPHRTSLCRLKGISTQPRDYSAAKYSPYNPIPHRYYRYLEPRDAANSPSSLREITHDRLLCLGRELLQKGCRIDISHGQQRLCSSSNPAGRLTLQCFAF